MVVLSKLSEGSSSIHGHRYDVFLSFRGLDTRTSFTAYLHKALVDANITTFLDDEEIETGEDLKPELESAIRSSRASVIVLSRNYATSTWCLDELVLILEQRKTSNHIVIPIFYQVEPTHVRKQQSSFGDAMAKHRQTMESEKNANKRSMFAQKIDRWNKALIEVVNLKGKDLNARQETVFIEEIVKDIYHRLHISSRSPLPQLFGMDNSIKFVNSWLKDASSHATTVLTILGMGGIEKTSLAKYVYALHFHEFDTSCFIKDIGPRCEKFNGLLDVQKQLYDDILKPCPIQVDDVSIYTSMIENVVARKKVFLVLDDIDSLDQLDALLGSKGFYPGSKIMITTKDAWLTESSALFKTNFRPKHTMHELKGISNTESDKLLCFHAFNCYNPKAGYEEVSNKLVNYCEGHPMALKVLGRSLHNRDVAYWEGYINRLKKENGFLINNVLRMSFDSLPSKNDKDLFKDISCFFVGMDRDVTETILQACGLETRTGFTNLIDRCLLSIGWDNELMMHNLVQEMGRFIVCEESPDYPWKRSRLWCHEDIYKVLKQKKGKGNLLGLALDMQKFEKEKLGASFELRTNALRNMDHLMLLKLNYAKINGSYKNFPKNLRWLCMHGFPLKSLPSDLRMKHLAVLDMSYSNIESFGICYSNLQRLESRQNLTESCSKEKMLLGSLKILSLRFCEQLCSLGGFDQLPALERLIVTNCTCLLEVCDSLAQCVELVFIDLSYCNKLKKLPRSLGMLKKVKTLLLVGCNLFDSQLKIMDTDSPETPKGNIIGINTIPSSSAILEAIPRDSKFFAVYLPRSIVSLSLKYTNLSVESFPMDFSCLFMLKELYLDGNPIVSMPNCVRSLPRLEILGMSNCQMLTSVEYPPHTLRELILYSYCESLLRKVIFYPEMPPLWLKVAWTALAPSLFEIEGMVKIQPIAGVEEKVLHSLGWSKHDFVTEEHVGTSFQGRGFEEFEIQMYYEFGIFSTIYGGKKMPSWLMHRSKGSSLSFTIPSSPNLLTGLNFCCVRMPEFLSGRLGFVDDEFLYLPQIIITNITKNRTWTYGHYIDGVDVGGKCLMLLSHWMFGLNEMEGGDQVTITSNQVTKECGVSFVYDNGEEDALGYYKSWNHIIGGDLTAFQLTTGEYLLSVERFMARDNKVPPWHYHLVGDHVSYKGRYLWDKTVRTSGYRTDA